MVNFKIPDELIAQEAVSPRDACRMLVLHRSTQNIEHRQFRDLIEYLDAGDLLIFNNTKVLKARLFAQKNTGGKVEVLLLEALSPHKWKVLLSGKKIKIQLELVFLDGLTAKVVEHVEKAVFILEFYGNYNIIEYTEKYGNIPLPPYIKRKAQKKDDVEYQTVFGKKLGSVASPTASLHFTTELLDRLKSKGVNFAYLTLHVGYGTFAPLENIETHKMHTEWFSVPIDLEDKLKRARNNKKKIIAVGTTVVRTLESAFNESLELLIPEGTTKLFIHTDYKFKVPSAIITNFHHHSTTLIHLVSAFAGYEFIEKSYKEAIKQKYRMLSYGDAMLIL